MNAKSAAAIVLAVLVMALAVPMVSDAGESATAEDVTITIQGGSDVIDIDLDSNESTTVEIFVENNSQDYVSVKVHNIGNDTFSSTSTIVINNASGSMLYPSGDADGRNIAIVTVTFQAERLADTGSFADTLVFSFTTVGTGDTFTESVAVTLDVESVYTTDDAYNKFFGIFYNPLPSPLNEPWVTALITLVLWIIASIIVCELVIPVLAKLIGARKSKEERKKITHSLTKTISILMFVVALNECLNIVGANAEIMSRVGSFSTVLYVIIGAVISWQVYQFIITALLRGIDEVADVDGMDTSLLPLFRLIGKVAICVLAATIILAVYGVDLAGIMVSAGVITLGITFGAQQIISQFFSGIVLLATRPFKKGDFVSINGTTYIVRKVKIMYTEFDSWDVDQVVTMPNNVVSAATLVNFTKGNANTRIYIYVTLAFDADLTKAKELMIQAANMHPHVIKDGTVGKPGTRLTKFLDYGLEYRLACYVDDYDSNSHYAGQIREIIYKLFMDNGIKLPYGRMQVELLGECDGRRKPDDDTPDS